MKIGMTALFNNSSTEPREDSEVFATDVRLALLAEPLGFDSLWTVEHHFSDYCLAPDPFQTLTWFAAKTNRIELGSMVVVLPWWRDPVRIVEKAALLDELSGGRFILGIGRGSAQREYEGFGISQEESRVRFDETAEMVIQGLEQGYCEYDGEFIKQKKVRVRPTPTRSFKGRRYGAAISPESCATGARLGLGMLINPQKPWEQIQEDIALHERIYRETHGEAPPPSITALTVYCDADAGRAVEVRDTWIRKQAENAALHYGLVASTPFGAGGSESDLPTELEIFVEKLAGMQIAGTPQVCVERLKEVHERAGSQHFSGLFSFAGLPENLAEASIRLFAKEVLPEIQKLGQTEPDPATAG